MEIFLENCWICLSLQLISYGLLAVTSIIVLCHIISTIHLRLKPHLKLTSNSFVVITGGCMGIGK